jgi:FkbM family methyltransferase
MKGLAQAKSSAKQTATPLMLVQHIRRLIESYGDLEYGRQLNPVDAFFAFRLLLGRNPDPVDELPGIMNDRRTFREYLTNLLNSDEFSRCVGFMPPNRMLMTDLSDFRLWFNSADREMGLLMSTGKYELQSVELIKKIVNPGMTCIDVGAHIGFYTCLIASLVGAGGRVYAFEPMPSNYELLLKNIEENKFQERVLAYPNACSDVHGKLHASKVSNMFVMGEVVDAEYAAVEAIRLDDVITDAGTIIDLIKLDAEGHEPAVIRGMTSIISRNKPIILSEINEYWLRHCSDSSAEEYLGLLMSLGYDVFDVKDLGHPLRESALNLDVLDTLDVIALPGGMATKCVPHRL